MSKQTKRFYEFGGFRLDVTQRILLRGNQVVPLTPKAFETLFVLVEHSGQIVDKEFLMRRIWPDTFVEEVSLARNISTLRKALGEKDGENQYIETFPRRGYRFVATVIHHLDEDDQEVVAESLSPLEWPAGSAVLAGAGEAGAGVPALTSPEAAEDSRHEKPGNYLSRQIMAIGIAAVIISLAGIFDYLIKSKSQAPESFQEMKFTQLTNTGKASDGVLSPDSKYVAYVLRDAGKHQLVNKHVATDSEVQIVPPTNDTLAGLCFSPDGNYIYYINRTTDRSTLYQSPVLGGASKVILEDIASSISFSPDGSRFAFVRIHREMSYLKDSSLMIANTDGTGEQMLATRTGPVFFGTGLAWTPSGESIACVVDNYAGSRTSGIVEVRLEDGTEKPITHSRWADIGRVAWLADGRHLVMTARDTTGSPSQIWLLSYPDGQEKRVTNDLADYRNISLSADTRTLMIRQSETFINIWTVPIGTPSQPRQITSGASYHEDLSWTPDGKIVFTLNTNSTNSIWMMEADGTNKRKLFGNNPINGGACVSPDGRYVVFVSGRLDSKQIWRIDSDGTNPKPLTDGVIDAEPQITPDGQWVIYSSTKERLLRKVSIEGGDSVQLKYEVSDLFPLSTAISPDGKTIACFLKEAQPVSQWRIAILPVEGGKPLKTLVLPLSPGSAGRFRWLHDGQAITYINDDAGVSNIWMQPLSGEPPKQITNFTSERITYFDWSRDGKQLACARGYSTNNLVLINNFK